MWRLVFTVVVSGSLLAAACGGDSDKPSPAAGTSSPAASATAKPPADEKDLRSHEAELRDAATAWQKSLFTAGAVKTYSYFADDFKDKCPLDDFAGLVALVKVFLGDVKDDDIEVEITGIRYEGGKAFVDSTGTINGDELSPDDDDEEYPEYWVRQDGDWKVTTDDPHPCDTAGAFGGDSSSDEKTPAATGPGTSRADAVAIGTAVRASDTEVTVLTVDLDAEDVVAEESSFPSTPEPGNRFVLARVRVKAVGAGDDTIDVGQNNFSMTGSANVVYEAYGENTSCGYSVADQLDAKLFPGGTAEGTVCFQVPRSDRGLILIFEPQFSFNNKDRRYLAMQ